MYSKIRSKYSLVFISVLLLFQCTTNQTAGIEITNGDCTGKIYTTDNKAAVGAIVRLISSGYDPTSGSGGVIDSTMTASDGSFHFKIVKTDFYNIIAEMGDASCIQDSIALLSDVKNQINPDTLRESGWLAGTIEVKPQSDPTKAIALIPGTNRYVTPYDSLGNFHPISLPAGTYIVRIFTTESGYMPLDTTITIPSGDTVYLNMRLPTTYAPDIKAFNATYDSLTISTTLTWPPVDTSIIQSYALHRYVNQSEDTIILLDKKLTSYTDDCIDFFEKTVQYQITSVGLNYKEGYKTLTPSIYICSKPGSVTRTPLGNLTDKSAFLHSASGVCFDNNMNTYLYTSKLIVKIAADGATLKKLDSTNFTGVRSVSVGSVSNDTRGNLYAEIDKYSVSTDATTRRSVVKLNSDLNIIDSLPIIDSLLCPSLYEEWNAPCVIGENGIMNFTDSLDCEMEKRFNDPRRRLFSAICVGPDGTVYQYGHCNEGTPVTIIRTYDANFNYLQTYTVNSEISNIKCNNDTIIATSRKYPEANVNDPESELFIITLYDRSFTPVTSYESIDAFATYPLLFESSPGLPATMVMPVSGTLCITDIGGNTYSIFADSSISSEILILYDNKGTVLERLTFPGDIVFTVQSSGAIYGFSSFFGPVLYKVPLVPVTN